MLLHRLLATRFSVTKGVLRQATYITTSANQPAEFGLDDVGKLYSIPNDFYEATNFKNNLPPHYRKQVQSIRECVLLYREQTQEVFRWLREVGDHHRPALRMVLWGAFGTGKTLTLCQLIHFAHCHGFVIFSVKDAMQWSRDNYREVQMSLYKPGRINSPFWAIRLLKNFKLQNQLLWNKLSELKTTKHYKWSQIESTKEGKPLTEIVEMGLTAPYLATDCIGALGRELRTHASKGSIKLLIAIDKANALYGKTVVQRPIDRIVASPDEMALNIHIRKFLMPIWSNGLCAMVADQAGISNSRDRLSVPAIDPLSLFGERGFEQIEPFVPVKTKNYSEVELEVIHGYYLEKKWMHQEEGLTGKEAKRQLMYLSAFNPFYYERLCATTWNIGCCLPAI